VLLSKIDEKTKKPHLWGWNFNIHLFMLLVSFGQTLHTVDGSLSDFQLFAFQSRDHL